MVEMNDKGTKLAPVEQEDEEEIDGWGPVRARRSSLPAQLAAGTATGEEEASEPDDKAPALKS
jgi:hypothetical protein